MEYVKMGLRGITVTVSSGDAGAPGRTNEICSLHQGVPPVNPAFPGSSPFITSVSATYIVPEESSTDNVWGSSLCKQYGCVNGTSELPCNYDKTGWTTGGGFAIYNENDEELKRYDSNNNYKSMVKTIKGDDLFKDTGSMIALKIDVERHEKELIYGIKSLLINNKAVIQIEIFDKRKKEVEELLNSINFNKFYSIGKDYYFKNY